MNHIENTFPAVTAQQQLDRCVPILCHGTPFTIQLTRDSPGIADMFTGLYQATAVVHSVTTQRRVYTPLHYYILRVKQFRTQIKSWGICRGQSGTGQIFSLINSHCNQILHTHWSPYHRRYSLDTDDIVK
jgi:hypothetical protein